MLLAEGVLFNLNIIASDNNITPPEFGSLILTVDGYLAGKNLKGENLSTIATYFDSVMTYWELFGITGTSGYNNIATFVNKVFTPINGFFYKAMDSTNYIIDVNGVKVDKNPYAITLTGSKTATDSGSIVNPPSEKTFIQSHFSSTTEVPFEFSLDQNYPNPFNPTTTLSFTLPYSSLVSLKVYNVLGQEVRTVFDNENLSNGYHEINFDASNIASGMYFYRLSSTATETLSGAKTFIAVKKMMLLK